MTNRQQPPVRPLCLVASLSAALALASAAGAEIGVVFSRAPQSPTSLVPGARDESGNLYAVRFGSILDFWLSPDGSRFIIRGATDPASTVDSYVLLGFGATGSVVLQENLPFPGAEGGEVVDFVGTSVGFPFNANNEWAFVVRARGGSNGVFNKILRFDAAGAGTLRFQGGNSPASGSPYVGLVDIPANPSGDETVGNSTASVHLLNDGRIGWQDTTVLNISTTRRPVTAYDAAKYRQTNVDLVNNLDGSATFPMSSIASTGTISVFLTSPDGSVKVLRGTLDVDSNASQTNDPTVVVVNDRVRIQTGQVIAGSTVTPTAISQTFVAANNDWYARGNDAAGAWATRNGAVIAKTGDSIGADAWAGTFFTVGGNSAGTSWIAGKSNNADPGRDDVLVVNGSVALREGDAVPIDLDGDGTLEEAFVGRANNTLAAFQANNSAASRPMAPSTRWSACATAAGATSRPRGSPTPCCGSLRSPAARRTSTAMAMSTAMTWPTTSTAFSRPRPATERTSTPMAMSMATTSRISSMCSLLGADMQSGRRPHDCD